MEGIGNVPSAECRYLSVGYFRALRVRGPGRFADWCAVFVCTCVSDVDAVVSEHTHMFSRVEIGHSV